MKLIEKDIMGVRYQCQVEFRNRLSGVVRDKIRGNLEHRVSDQIRDPVGDQIWTHVWAPVWNQIHQLFRLQ
jgi:hypothetical protein